MLSSIRRSLLSRPSLRFLVAAAALAAILGPSVWPPAVSDPILVTATLGASPLPAVEAPADVPGPLDGELTSRSHLRRRPIAVIVDNYSPDARPQYGLSRASLVMETLAEGGITRLMAVYLEKDVARVGPVRSTRTYFDRWAAAFHAALIHVGGNDDALALLWQLPKVYNIDQGTEEFIIGENPYFWRDDARQIPNNMFANERLLRRYAAANGQNWPYRQASLVHKSAAAPAQRGDVDSLTVSFVDPLFPFVSPIPDYTVRYSFDRATDTYLRIVGGKPAIDAGNGQPLRAANVVVMETGAGIADPAAGYTLDSILIPVIGSGTAWFFRDGTVTRGTWVQRDQQAPLQFLDVQGRPEAFNPGQTWIEVLPQGSTVNRFQSGRVAPAGGIRSMRPPYQSET
jgi:hypothetical protein